MCGFVCANLTPPAAYSQLIGDTSKNMHGILKAECVSAAAAAAADRECA